MHFKAAILCSFLAFTWTSDAFGCQCKQKFPDLIGQVGSKSVIFSAVVESIDGGRVKLKVVERFRAAVPSRIIIAPDEPATTCDLSPTDFKIGKSVFIATNKKMAGENERVALSVCDTIIDAMNAKPLIEKLKVEAAEVTDHLKRLELFGRLEVVDSFIKNRTFRIAFSTWVACALLTIVLLVGLEQVIYSRVKQLERETVRDIIDTPLRFDFE